VYEEVIHYHHDNFILRSFAAEMSDSEEEVEYEVEEFTVTSQKGINYVFAVTTVAIMPLTRLASLSKNPSATAEISGQKVWCGSLGVMQWLMKYPFFVQGAVICELGAGTGVVGMLAARLGASMVQLTDWDHRSLAHMHSDAPVNRKMYLDSHDMRNGNESASCCECTIHHLDWYDPNPPDPWSVTETTKDCVDHHLVAGDVLYKHELLKPFFSTAALLLSLARNKNSKDTVNDPKAKESPSGESREASNQQVVLDVKGSIVSIDSSPMLLLCHVPRAGVAHEEVCQAAQGAGLVLSDLGSPGPDPNCPPEDTARARLYLFGLA
jgi:predicted nicotinamide N-methyase